MSVGSTFLPAIERRPLGQWTPYVLGALAAVLAVLAVVFHWVVAVLGALIVTWLAATEYEPFLLLMVFLIPIQWRLASGFPVASAIRSLLVVAFFAGRFIRGELHVRKLLSPSLTKASLCFVGAGLASLVFGNPGWVAGSAQGFARLVSYVGFYLFLLAWVDSRQRLERVIAAILWSVVLLASFGFIQFLFHSYTRLWLYMNPGVVSLIAWSGRPPSFLGADNDLAEYLNLALALALAQLALGDFRRRKLASWALGLGAAVLMLTQSRGGLVAFALTLVVAIFSIVRSRKRQLKLVGALAAAVAAFYLVGKVFSPEHLGGIEHVTAIGRLIMWNTAVQLFARSPWFGVGLWNFPLLYNEYINLPQLFPPGFLSTHDLYLQLLSETGIVGFVTFFAVVWLAFRQALHEVKTRCEKSRKVVGFAVLWGLAALLAHGILESPLGDPEVATLLWSMFALLSISSRLSRTGTPLPSTDHHGAHATT